MNDSTYKFIVTSCCSGIIVSVTLGLLLDDVVSMTVAFLLAFCLFVADMINRTSRDG